MGLAGASPAGDVDVLEILVVPDLPQDAGQYRLVPKGLGAFPNLPRCGPATTVDSLAALLDDPGIVECGDGNSEEVAAVLGGRLCRAMEKCGI